MVADIVQELRGGTGHGVFLVGPHGVGKTWLVGQVLAALGTDVAVIRLSPSAALSRIPFGAVNARISTTTGPHDDFYSVLAALAEQVVMAGRPASGGTGGVVLVVDNAGQLDADSAAVIAQVVLDGPAKLILVDHLGAGGHALHQLWRDGVLVRHELGPLVAGEIQGLMEQILGGKVAGAAASYMAQRSGGNVGVLKGLLAGALEQGTLRDIDDVWTLDHPGDHLGAESKDFLRMDLGAVGAASRRIVDILALAGPLPLDTVLRLCSADELDEVQQSEIATITLGRQVMVQLARPAYGAAIRELVPVGRSRALRAEVAAVFDPVALDLHDAIISDVAWRLDCGHTVDDELLLRAATLANWHMRTSDALRISGLVDSGPLQAAALAQQSLAAFYSLDLPLSRTLAARSMALADNAAAAVDALEAFFRSNGSEPAFGLLFDEALADFHRRFGPTSPDGDAASPGYRVEIVQALVDLSLGRLAAVVGRTEALLANPALADKGLMAQLMGMRCEALSALGRSDEAVAMAGMVLALLDEANFPRPDISVLAYARACAAIIHHDDWALAARLLEDAGTVHHSLILPSGGLRHMGLAMMFTRMGRIDEALVQLRPCLSALAEFDPWLVRSAAFGISAYCLALRGDDAAARQRLDELAGMSTRGNAVYALEGAAYASAAEAIMGDSTTGVDELRRILAYCHDQGFVRTEFTVAMLMVRVGDPSAVDRMLELAEAIPTLHRGFYVAYSQAMAAQKGELLEEASVAAAAYGFDLLAAELAACAQDRFLHRGQQQRSRKAAAALAAIRDRMPGIVSPMFTAVDRPELTRREAEIARFVAAGHSNHDIADRLQVSLRTVEGHLYRMFIKLDIKSRDELALITRSLLGAGTST